MNRQLIDVFMVHICRRGPKVSPFVYNAKRYKNYPSLLAVRLKDAQSLELAWKAAVARRRQWFFSLCMWWLVARPSHLRRASERLAGSVWAISDPPSVKTGVTPLYYFHLQTCSPWPSNI